MKISIIGAGPAGLYFAILMKKADPSHEISVYEMNPPNVTWGWGVVFSEVTLGVFRDADYDSYVSITDTFSQWDAIDIHYQGTMIRSRGHVMSAMSRKELLRVLQERCAELGVEITFEAQVSSLERFADSDLIVGADGVNSIVREHYAEQLKPRRAVYETKYAWFGTDLVFDAFTFAFRETEHGLIQAHAYPFDGDTSTFIVECTDAVFERAGLGELDEAASMAYCEELFAEQLCGHRLLSNRSLWMSFQQINVESWHTGNVVLLGDSAHTAHFTIGSGTKLAMESALALANAFVRHDEIEPALVEYEMEREPVVERFQEVARDSATYFENVKNYSSFDPVQFAFNLLTRSGRIGYANMTMRDARFMRTVDGWFGGTAGGDGEGPVRAIAPPPMFTSLPLADAEVANRVAVSPIAEDACPGGVPGEGHVAGYREAAGSGAGLLLTQPIAISPEARITPECPTLEGDSQIEGWRSVVDAAHAGAGALVCAQLNHAGRRGSTLPRRLGVDLPLRSGGWPLLSASAIPYGPGTAGPKEIDEEGMERVIEEFATVAEGASRADFDALEVNLAQGYLPASFISPISNRREDTYGGELEQRLAFPLRVLHAVREAWGAARPLVARISAADWAPRGARIEDGVEVARVVGEHSDLIHVVAGQARADCRPEYRRSYLTPLADRIRSEAAVTTLVGGYITPGDEINTAVGAGRADLCLFDPRALEPAEAVR